MIAKINVADGRSKGAQLEDGIVTAKILEEAGADMLVLSGGRNVESGWFTFGSNMNLDAMLRHWQVVIQRYGYRVNTGDCAKNRL